MHPEPATGATAAAMVAELGGAGPVIAWCALTTPCTSVFLPVAVGTELPLALTRGAGEPDAQSAWWLMKALGDEVMADPVGRTQAVQCAWHAWEHELFAEVDADRAATGRKLGQRVARMLQERERLHDRLVAAGAVAHGGQ
jgi:dipeptidase